MSRRTQPRRRRDNSAKRFASVLFLVVVGLASGGLATSIDEAVDVARAAFGFTDRGHHHQLDGRRDEVVGGARANTGHGGPSADLDEEKQITFPKAFATQADLRNNILNGIVEYGVNQTRFLYNIEEPRLFRKGQ